MALNIVQHGTTSIKVYNYVHPRNVDNSSLLVIKLDSCNFCSVYELPITPFFVDNSRFSLESTIISHLFSSRRFYYGSSKEDHSLVSFEFIIKENIL